MFRIVNRLIQWTGKYKRRIYIGFIYAFIHSIFTAIPIMLAAKGLSAVLDDFNGVKPLEGRDIWIMLGAMILAVLGRYLFSYLRAITQESVGYEATADERIRLGDILKRVSLGFFSKNNMGELSAAATTDLSFMEMFAMNMVNTVVNGYITVIVLILFLAFYSPLAGEITLAGVLLSALFLHLLEARSHQNAPIHQKAQDDMVESSIEYLRGMQVVKAFKQEGVSIAGIRKAYNDSKKINIKIEVEYMPFNCLHLFSLKAASIAIVAVAAMLTYNGSMELPTMLMLDMFSFMIFGSVEAMNNAAHVLEVIDATLDKLDGIEHADIIDKDGKDISLQNTDIAFRDVTFSYDKVPVLRNISFSIPQGSTTAIVGPSGSGKTTICNLIARFYDVDSGKVTVGGEDVRNMTCDSLLRNISMVFQKVYLFHDTIENNIRFGNPSATQEEIIAKGLEIQGINGENVSANLALVAHSANKMKKTTVSLVRNGERHSFEVVETPFHAGQSLDKICTAGALIDVTELDELKRNLKLHQNAHLEILGALGTAFAVFDSNFKLSFYNKAFAAFWELEDVWLESGPSYAAFLDLIREKRMLPEVPDFRLYKNEEQKDFSAIIEPKEDMLHLPDGRTFRRVRAPHPMGGLVFAFEDVSDRLATRRAYNSLLSVQQEILDNLFDPVLIFGSNGRLNFFNKAYLEMWKVDEIELQNEPGIDEIIESQAKFFGNVENWLQLKKDIIQHLTSLTTKSFSLKRSDGVSIEVLTAVLSDGSIMITYKQL